MLVTLLSNEERTHPRAVEHGLLPIEVHQFLE